MLTNDGQPIRVLVVEDEPIILRYIAGRIESIDACFALCGTLDNAPEALQFLSKKPVDILVTDIEMPGLSGLDLIKHAKKVCTELHTIIISGYDNFSYAQRAIRYGAFEYLLKPIEEAELRSALLRLKKRIAEERLHKSMSIPEEPAQAAPQSESAVQQIEQYIRAQYNKPLTIHAIAEYFSYTPTYINRLFKKRYNISPIQYQITLRMNKAKSLLLEHQDLDIKDVARHVGYDDARYFSRLFRQYVGMTPSEYVGKTRG